MGFVKEETAEEEKSIVFFEAARAFPREQKNVASQNTFSFFKIISQEEPLRSERKNIYVLADASNYWFSSFLIFQPKQRRVPKEKISFLIIWIYRCFEGAPREKEGSFSPAICVMSH